MSKEKDASFGEMLQRGAREAAAHATGDQELSARAQVTRRTLSARHVRLRSPPQPSPHQIREVRHRLDLSQAVFAALLNVSPSTVRAWEQGQRQPNGPSLRLLEIAEHHPTALLIMADQSASRRGELEDRAGEEPPSSKPGEVAEEVPLGD